MIKYPIVILSVLFVMFWSISIMYRIIKSAIHEIREENKYLNHLKNLKKSGHFND